jgi:hypothetical protein
MTARRIAIHRYHGLCADAAPNSSIEWVVPDKRDAVRLAQRIRQRHVDGVVLVQADLSHGISGPILTACRLMGVTFTACEKRSQNQIRSALDAIECLRKE